MRLITLLFTLLFWFNAVAVAPYGIKGQSQSGTLYSNVHQFPNNQVTNMGGINALVETGNKNILVNPSFEHSTFSTGWTSGAGSFSQNLTVEIDGLKAAEVTLSAQALAITQDSTLYAAQFADGVQGLASVRVKTSLSGIKVCSRQAGVTSTTNCVNVQGNGKWGLYKVPMILGATSNGISIASNGTSLTGTVYLDDAFVGATDLKQEMNACNSPSCETEFSAAISAAGVITQESSDWLGTCVRSGIGNRTATCTVNPSLGLTTGMNCTGNINQAVTSAFSAGVVNVVSTSSTNIVFDTAQASDGTGVGIPAYIICQKQGADFTAAKQLSNGNTYSSTNADTDWASCGLTGASFTGFGSSVPTPSLQCKRQGGDLLIKGTFQAGTTPTSVEARMALPLWNGVQLVSAGSSIIPSVQLAGNVTRNATSVTYFGSYALIEPSVSYITFGVQDSTQNAYTKVNGNNLTNSGNNLSINARIPIAGWEQSNIIIGQFNGLESCTNTLECTDTFSAKISQTGVVSGENVEWLSGNCSNPTAGTYNCTINTGIFSQIPNCTATAEGLAGSPNTAMLNITSATALNAFLRNTSNGVQSSVWNLVCQKQGIDYVGKTAKAVASDQNVATPGTTKSTLCSAKISSTGVISDQKGGCFSSCTNATTPVCTFTSNYWVSTPNCWIIPDFVAALHYSLTNGIISYSGFLTNTSGTPVSGSRIYFCHGERQ